MKKRICAMLLAMIVIIGLAPLNTFALEPTVVFTVAADKSEVNPGDEVTFTLGVSATTTIATWTIELNIPEGFSYVENSGAIDSNLKTITEADGDVSFTEKSTLFFIVTSSLEGLKGLSNLTIGTFKCKVDSDAAIKDYTVGVNVTEVADAGLNAYKENEGFKVNPATITVTPAPKPATGIKLNKTTLTLKDSESNALTATVTPADSTETVIWSSSNEKVATVDENGKVTAQELAKGVKEDTAIISAKIGTLEAACTVTVQCAHASKDRSTFDAVAPKCTTPGSEAYQRCEKCGQLLDADGKEISEVTEIPAVGHTYVHHDAVAATCTKTGMMEYYTCSKCDQIFDANKRVTMQGYLTLPMIDHDYKWVIDKEPTEEAPGLKHEECTVCHAKCNEDTVIDALPHTHSMTHHVAETATCTEPGTVEYYSCSKCGKNFADSVGATELTSIVAPALGHKLTKTGAKAATCTEAGSSEYYTCTTCGKFFSDAAGKNEITQDSWVIAALGHKVTKTDAKAATCTEAGNGEYYTCTACGKFFSDAAGENEITKNSWVINALGHTLTKTGAKAATCTEAGNSEYYTCATCGKFFSDAAGKNEITQDSWVIDALGHKMSDWKGDSEGHWQECLNCDRKTEKMPHEPDRDAPTVNDPVKCKVCGYELMPVLPTVKVEIPFTVTVKQGGTVAPGKQSFELEVFNIGNGNTGEYSDVTVTAAVETNGKGDYTAKLVISGSEEQVNAFISEGFYVREKNTGATGWTYSDAVWHVMFEDSLPTVYPTTVKTDANGASYEDGEAVENNTMAFVNTYTMNETVKPTPDTPADTPKTGDTGVTVWLVALPVAALAAAVVIGKKKHENE